MAVRILETYVIKIEIRRGDNQTGKKARRIFPVALIDLLALHQPFPYPTWIAAAIKYSKNHNLIVNDSIICGEWEPLGELAVVSKNQLVNASEVC